MNKLNNLIVTNRDILIQKLQKQVCSFLDLHLPECVVANNLSPQQLYSELSLHAYAYFIATKPLAKTIMSLLYKNSLPNDDVVDEILEKTYIPKAKKIIRDQFNSLFSNKVDDILYEQLPANYTGIKYLQYFLPSDKLPRVRKPYQLSELTMDELFIVRASELTIYNRGKLIKKPKRGYGQYCQWERCKDKTEFVSVYNQKAFSNSLNLATGCGLYYLKNGQVLPIRVVRFNEQVFFVCSKKCYDALLISLKRKGQPSN